MHILILVISSAQFNTDSTDSAVKMLCFMYIPSHKEVNLLGSNSSLGLERRRRAEAADSASISSTSPSSSFSPPSCSFCSSLTSRSRTTSGGIGWTSAFLDVVCVWVSKISTILNTFRIALVTAFCGGLWL